MRLVMGRTTNATSSSSSSSSPTSSVMGGDGKDWNLSELARWVPVRLSSQERQLLTVLEQTLHVSEYTDHVDVSSRRGGTKTKRILDQILEACHISTGLVSASGQGRELAASLSSSSNSLSRNSHNSQAVNGVPYELNGQDQPMGHHRLMISGKKKKTKLIKNGKGGRRKGGKGGGKNKKGLALNGTGTGTTEEETATADDLIFTGSWAGRNPQDNALLFQTMFEVGRRNKVLNPASMRTTYGKLMYLLQDAQNATVAKTLGFSLHKDLVLVKPFLAQHDCLDLLHDPRLECAVQYIHDRDVKTGEKLPREHVEFLIQGKRKVTEELVEIYSRPRRRRCRQEQPQQQQHKSNGNNDDNNHSDDGPAEGGEPDGIKETKTKAQQEGVELEQMVEEENGEEQEEEEGFHLSAEDVYRVIESLADAISYIESNVRPVQQMLQYLEDNFDPEKEEKFFSLALRGTPRSLYGGGSTLYSKYGLSAYNNAGSYEGPTLSHSHSTQYVFVWQSLRLWCKVMRHMHQLWVCADDDLLSTASSYHLYNTGQGLNRVQLCPRVRKVMSQLLQQTQSEAGKSWVGLSVVHLGDRDVPNALIFIDKYTQIPRFLTPLVQFLQSLPELCEDERIGAYITEHFGSPHKLKLTVLADYFKHGFDGSGDDGGSCIDGRLTSSWNWTSRLAKKNYYHAFMLSGFQGFDGEFR